MPESRNRSPWTRLIVTLVLAGVVFGLLSIGIDALIPVFVNIPSLKKNVESGLDDALASRFPVKTDIGDLSIHLTVQDGIHVVLKSITLVPQGRYQGQEPLRVREAQASVRYWPLISSRTVDIAGIELDGLFVDWKKSLPAPAIEEHLPSQKRSAPFAAPKVPVQKVTQPSPAPKITFHNTRFTARNLHLGLAQSEAKPRPFQGSVDIKRFHLAHLFSDAPVLVRGRDWVVTVNQTRPLVVSNLRADVDLATFTGQLGVLEGTVHDTPVRLAGTVNLGKQAIENGLVQMDSLDLGAIRDTWLAVNSVFPLPSLPWLEHNILSGTISTKLRLDGSLRQPVVSGPVTLRQLSYTPAENIEKPPLFVLDGTFTADGSRIHTTDFTLSDAKNRISLSGTYTLADQTLDHRLSGQNIHLPWLQSLINTLSREFRLKADALQQLQVSGITNFNVSVTGPISKPKSDGTVSLAGATITDTVRHVTVSGLHGNVRLDDLITLHDLQGKLDVAGFAVSGTVDPKTRQYRFFLNLDEVALKTLQPYLQEKLPPALRRSARIQGTARGNIQLSGKLPDPKSGKQPPLPNLQGDLQLDGVSLLAACLPDPVRFPALKLNLSPNGNIHLPQTRGSLGPIGLTISAQGNLPKNQVTATIQTTPVELAYLREHQQQLSPWLPLPELWNTQGTVALQAQTGPDGQHVRAGFNQAALSWKGGLFPVYGVNGTLDAALHPGGNVSFRTRNFQLTYADSPITLSAELTPAHHLEVTGQAILSPILLNQLIAPPRSQTSLAASLPLEWQVSGMLGPLKAFPHKSLNLNTHFSTVLDALASDLNLTAPLLPDMSDVSDASDTPEITEVEPQPSTEPSTEPPAEPLITLSGNTLLTADTLTLTPVRLNLSEVGRVLIDGTLHRPFDPEQTGGTLHIYTPTDAPLDFSANPMFQRMAGLLDIDLQAALDPTPGASTVNGHLAAADLKLPALTLQTLTGRVNFEGDHGTLVVDRLRIPGVDVSATGNLPELMWLPQYLDNIRIQGPLFVVEASQRFMEKIWLDRVYLPIIDRIHHPWMLRTAILPFEFRNADITLDEAIFQNIILKDLTSTLTLYTNSYLELNHLKLTVADGSVEGHITVSPGNNNFLTVELNAQHVQANALARAILNAPNQIFGTMTGDIRYTTQGVTEADVFNNANGAARFVITDGRLPTVAKIETLLTAANVIRGGLLGLNLNNLIRTVSPFETNYFAELSGNLQIAQGVGYTDDLLSDGENLDLLIQGSTRLLNADANLSVYGSMSQDVSGKLGKLGQFSLGRLLQFIPGLGYLPGIRGGIVSYIPGVGYIPGFGGPAKELNEFRVVIDGPLDNMGSIQSFDWL